MFQSPRNAANTNGEKAMGDNSRRGRGGGRRVRAAEKEPSGGCVRGEEATMVSLLDNLQLTETSSGGTSPNRRNRAKPSTAQSVRRKITHPSGDNGAYFATLLSTTGHFVALIAYF